MDSKNKKALLQNVVVPLSCGTLVAVRPVSLLTQPGYFAGGAAGSSIRTVSLARRIPRSCAWRTFDDCATYPSLCGLPDMVLIFVVAPWLAVGDASFHV